MSARHELSEHDTPAGGEADLRQVLNEAGDTRELGRTQIVVEQGGRIAAYKPAKTAADLRLVYKADANSFATSAGLRIKRRELFFPRFNATYRIYAAEPIDLAQAQVRRALNLLLIAVAVGLLAATLAGNWFAGRALKPLEDFADSLGHVTSSELAVRVPVKNPGDDIGRLALRFNELMDRLEQAFTLQRRFMADASHQIRTPVTVALVCAQVTARNTDATREDLRQSLKTTECQMLQLARIVDDMFFLAHADSAPLKLERREIYFDDAVAAAVRAAQALARIKNQVLHSAGLPEARCSGDIDLLTQAVLVLLDNAVKFTPEGGVISVEICRMGANWVCSVTDNGIGIPEMDQGHIFERFFQAEGREGLVRKGAGLGLAIARSIIESHGGHVALAVSRPGMTKFEIYLPAVDELLSRNPPGNVLRGGLAVS
jgi:signal transduction histidine kinase